jgi:dimethylhistidine N-methyltransferase
MDDRVVSEREYREDNNEPDVVLEQNFSAEKPLSSDNQLFLDEVLEGLDQAQKTLPCKYFYDDKGSQLFEQICELEEYYITRVELTLLEDIKTELAEMIGQKATIIEPGAGAGIKIRTLLKALDTPESYVPMDISKEFLFYSAQIIQNEFPQIEIMPIQGDFTEPVSWLGKEKKNNRVVFFPGSTIGNFEQNKAIDFLNNMQHLIGKEGALIIGVDLLKEQNILEAAYNDSKGITEAFNKNLLARINQQLNANFDLKQFKHEAFLNHQDQRIEMHLVSLQDQAVTINGKQFDFSAFESIHTENSHKHSVDGFLELASKANLKCLKTWIDDQQMFSVHYLVQK